MTEEILEMKAIDKVISIYGKEYLQKNFDKTWFAKGFIENGEVYYYFIGIKTKHDLPNRTADDSGWTIRTEIRYNAKTGEQIFIDSTVE